MTDQQFLKTQGTHKLKKSKTTKTVYEQRFRYYHRMELEQRIRYYHRMELEETNKTIIIFIIVKAIFQKDCALLCTAPLKLQIQKKLNYSYPIFENI